MEFFSSIGLDDDCQSLPDSQIKSKIKKKESNSETQFNFFNQLPIKIIPNPNKKTQRYQTIFKVDIQGLSECGMKQAVLRLLLNCLNHMDYKMFFSLDTTSDKNKQNNIKNIIRSAIDLSGLQNISEVFYDEGKNSFWIEITHISENSISYISQKSDRSNAIKLESFKHYNDDILCFRIPTNVPPKYTALDCHTEQLEDKNIISNPSKIETKASIRKDNPRYIQEILSGKIEKLQILFDAYKISDKFHEFIPIGYLKRLPLSFFQISFYGDINVSSASLMFRSLHRSETTNQVCDFDVLKFLINNGIDLNSKDENAKTLLMIAEENNDVDGAMLLIDNGAMIHETPICENDVRILINKILIINAKTGQYPKRKEIAKELVDCMIKTSFKSDIPLVARAARLGNIEAMDYVAGMKYDKVNSYDLEVSLGFACRYGYTNIAMRLINNGVNKIVFDESKYPVS